MDSSLYLRPLDSGASGQPVDTNMIGVHDGVVRWPLQNVRRRPSQTAVRGIARQKDASLRQRDDFIPRVGESALGSENNEKAPDLKRGAYRWKGDDCAPSEWGNAVDRASKRAGKLGRGNEHSFRQGAPGGQITKARLAGLITHRPVAEQGIGGRWPRPSRWIWICRGWRAS